jgi:hypothetical protein
MRGAACWLALLAHVGCGDDEAVAGRSDAAAETGAEVASDTARDAAAEETSAPVAEVAIPETGEVTEDAGGEVGEEVLGGSDEPLDPDLIPCEQPRYWPFSILSARVPMRVHHRMPEDAEVAREIVAILEYVWAVQIDELGFAAPLSDDGSCGPDAALDVFMWRDAEDVYVDIWQEDERTPWDDWATYMVVDPWGEFGGAELAVTLAHEFNHMCQAVHDWSDAAFIYEATATFIEDVVYDDHDSYLTILYDFQGNPDWSLDRDDGYETWYMYGAMLWLEYLRTRYFKGDARFVADLWLGLRSPWDENEPDFADSLDELLAPFGVSYADTVVEFARWRWYVGERDDGRHLPEAGAFPPDATPKVAATIDASGGSAVVRPMMLGTAYVDIVGTGDEVLVTLESGVADSEVWWVVQALPGVTAGSDGETLRLPAAVTLSDEGGRRARTLAVTALPGTERDIDPDTRTDERFPVTIRTGTHWP